MNNHYLRIIKDSEKRSEYFLKRQLLDNKLIFNGGLLNDRNYCDPKDAMNSVTTVISLYLNKDSQLYKDKVIYDRISLSLDYIERIQRENGLFDLLNCNFYSAPDTAFGVNRLVMDYRLFNMYGSDDLDKLLKVRILNIIKSSALGLVKGGFHTPNHRWAIAACLMSAYTLTHIEEFKTCADKYLSEGLDVNKDGEYSERSSGIYNIVNNEQMMILAEETGNNLYLKCIEKNLRLMLTYLEPDGSVFTNNSTRQDNDKKMYPVEYYFQYLYIGYYNKNDMFGTVANDIMEQVIERGDLSEDCLFRLMLHPELIAYEPKVVNYEKNYSRFYKESGIVRVRKEDISYSILQDSSKFLFFQVGELKAYMKLGVSYFAEREFKAKTIEQTENRFVLNYSARGWYYKPFQEKPETTDWWKMDHSKRELIEGPNVDVKIEIKDVEKGIEVNICTEGIDRVPLKVEIGVSKDAFIDNEAFMCQGSAENTVTVKSGDVTVRKGKDSMIIGPAFANHFFVDGKFGSEEKSRNHFTIYFTDFTKFSHTICFKKI